MLPHEHKFFTNTTLIPELFLRDDRLDPNQLCVNVPQ